MNGLRMYAADLGCFILVALLLINIASYKVDNPGLDRVCYIIYCLMNHSLVRQVSSVG